MSNKKGQDTVHDPQPTQGAKRVSSSSKVARQNVKVAPDREEQLSQGGRQDDETTTTGDQPKETEPATPDPHRSATPGEISLSPPERVPPERPSQCLTFVLGGEEYAVGILAIREIVEYSPLARVPTAPPWIHGVMNLRGSVVPVVDLALKFGRPAIAVGPRTCIVVVEAPLDVDEAVMGLLVDGVNRVIDVDAESFEPAPTFGLRVRVHCLVGLIKDESVLVPILDLNRVLCIEELSFTRILGTGGSGQAARGGNPVGSAGATGEVPR